VAADRYKRPCFDSSVFVGGIRNEIANGIKRGVVFRFLWDKAKAGGFPVFVSAIALAEVYKIKAKPRPESAALDEFLECLNEPFVQIIEVDREIGLKAHALCREYSPQKLLPNDAVHLACALRAKCDYLLAWDTPLRAVSHPEILIEEPIVYDRVLFAESENATADEIKAYEAEVATQISANQAAGNARAVAERHAAADALADKIVAANRDGSLPTPFTTKHVRQLLAGQFEDSHLLTVLPNYCEGGDQVKRGRQARFRRISRGNYTRL
jgi:predicted nucleic acid-binding protein